MFVGLDLVVSFCWKSDEPSSMGSKAVLTEDWRTPLIILALPNNACLIILALALIIFALPI